MRGRGAEATLGMFSREDIYPETQRKKKGHMWWAGAKKIRRRLEQDELKRKTGVKSCMDL